MLSDVVLVVSVSITVCLFVCVIVCSLFVVYSRHGVVYMCCCLVVFVVCLLFACGCSFLCIWCGLHVLLVVGTVVCVGFCFSIRVSVCYWHC